MHPALGGLQGWGLVSSGSCLAAGPGLEGVGLLRFIMRGSGGVQHYNFFEHYKAGTLDEYKQFPVFDFHGIGERISCLPGIRGWIRSKCSCLNQLSTIYLPFYRSNGMAPSSGAVHEALQTRPAGCVVT